MIYKRKPEHDLWIVDWIEQCSRYKSAEFSDYEKANELFHRLKEDPDLNPVIEGFAHH